MFAGLTAEDVKGERVNTVSFILPLAEIRYGIDGLHHHLRVTALFLGASTIVHLNWVRENTINSYAGWVMMCRK
jgi:hypothetical protein